MGHQLWQSSFAAHTQQPCMLNWLERQTCVLDHVLQGELITSQPPGSTGLGGPTHSIGMGLKTAYTGQSEGAVCNLSSNPALALLDSPPSILSCIKDG